MTVGPWAGCWAGSEIGVLMVDRDVQVRQRIHHLVSGFGASQVGLMVENPSDNAGDLRHRFDLCVEKIPWRREW